MGTVLVIHWLTWAIDVKTWTVIHVVSLVGTMVVFIIFMCIYLSIDLSGSISKINSQGVWLYLTGAEFWLLMLISVVSVILPYTFVKTISQDQYFFQEKLNE